ncbi:MAG: PD-(D/E)XK nuclease family protein [Bacteroidota bacterium]
MSFLEQIILELKEEFGDGISELCLIVPSRRAVLFLKHALAKVYQSTIWAPRIISIQDFVRELSGEQFPDILPLVFDLYQVYMDRMRAAKPDFFESFEAFYSWGEMLVKDFDELDKYMVDAQQLFTNVHDLKEIEAFFSIPEENRELIKSFWRTLRGREVEPTEMQQKFLRIWEVLFDIYSGFRASLKERHMAYDGMAYRQLVDELEAGEMTLPYPKTIFIGFNALSTAEERMMKHLLSTEQGIVYWDVDRAYFTPPGDRLPGQKKRGHIAGEEPGKFIKGYHYAWKDMDSRLIVHDMAASPKQIELTGAPLHVAQAQYLGNLLTESPVPPEEFQRCAIVLADEQLLFPVLYALPDDLTQLNITMGFRLRQTQIYSLLLTLMRLLNSLRIDANGELIFAHVEVEDILNNPYIKAHHPQLSLQIQKEIHRKNLLFVGQTFMAKKKLSPLLTHIFSPPRPDPTQTIKNLAPLIDYCEGVLTRLLEDAQKRQARLESEYIYHFYRWFQELREVLERYQPSLSLQGFTRLVRESMQKVRIPFEGEPLIGVQIMGFLETRVLDFDRVYILGANEGSLPDTSTGNSFLPYNLRKGFGLPTYEEKDAIYAYHFYRLVQRSKEIHLIYNQEVSDGGGAKEQSRFIRQIEHFFRDHPNLQAHHRMVSTPAPYAKRPEIHVSMSEEIQASLRQRFHKEGSGRYLSATAMTTYLACPLRFYYHYVANIREPQQVEESMEANTFGSVLHETMEFLYEPLLGQLMTKARIDPLHAKLDAALKKAFRKNELAWGTELRGKNYLLRGVIKDLCERILQADAEGDPFVIRSLEDQESFLTALDIQGEPYLINGAFDRVDYIPEKDLVRIIDYKTGKIDLSAKTVSDCFDKPKLKAAFQGYLYAWLYDRQHPGVKTQVGFYTARQLSGGIHYLQEGKAVHEEELAAFSKGLSSLIAGLLRKDFVQTDDEQQCRICPYNEICNRGR